MALIQGAFGGSSVGPQGPEGPQGPPGPVGPAGLEWRGQWSISESYIIDDAVGYNGASYFCISNNTGTPPTEKLTDTNWALLAAEGMQGAQGKPGIVWRGLWLPSIQYVKDDAVLYSSLGGSFIAISDNIGAPPTGMISDPNWSYLAARGQDGISPIVSDSFRYDTFNYSGSTSISSGSFVNILGLPAVSKATGGTAGITIGFGVLKFPANSKPTGITFSLQITGTVGGASGTAREWKIQLRRPNGTTVVRSVSTVKVNGTDISNRDVDITSRTFNATDLFTTQGVMVGIQNDSGQAITLTSASLTVHRYLNQS